MAHAKEGQNRQHGCGKACLAEVGIQVGFGAQALANVKVISQESSERGNQAACAVRILQSTPQFIQIDARELRHQNIGNCLALEPVKFGPDSNE